jgi:ubiquinone/menaquinone biosynthesis C-methylase UbiE
MQSFQGFFSRHAKDYAKSESHMHGKDLDLLVSLLDLKKEYKLLDVGTGPGFVAFEAAKKVAVAVGMDITDQMLDIAVRKSLDNNVKNVVFIKGNATNMPFPGNSFDVITCRRVNHHIKDNNKFLEEAFRVLKDNGKIGITDLLKPISDKKGLFNKLEKARDSTYFDSMSLDAWFKLLKQNGFTVSTFKTFSIIETFESWLSPLNINSIEARRARNLIRQNITYFRHIFDYDENRDSFKKYRMVIIAKKGREE